MKRGLDLWLEYARRRGAFPECPACKSTHVGFSAGKRGRAVASCRYCGEVDSVANEGGLPFNLVQDWHNYSESDYARPKRWPAPLTFLFYRIKALVVCALPFYRVGECLPHAGLVCSEVFGVLFVMPLPFVWRDYSYFHGDEVWGCVKLVLSRRHRLLYWSANLMDGWNHRDSDKKEGGR